MTKNRASVLILHNVPRPAAPGAAFAESDAGVLDQVRAVEAALARLKIPSRVAGVANLADVPAVLSAASENVVFNLVEGFHSRPSDSNYVPALAAAYGKAATGNDSPALALSLNKWHAKCVLLAHDVPCPPGVIVPVGSPVPRAALPPGPYIVKPLLADASEGIDAYSVVRSRGKALSAAVARVHHEFAHEALVETLVGHREINVSVLQQRSELLVLPLAEIDFCAFGDDRPRIVGYSAKWLPDTFEYQNTPRVIPAPLSAAVAARVTRCALAAWRALGCRDYARVDMRLDDKGRPFVLEVNTNPDITPDAGFAAALEAARISYDSFVKTLVDNALSRLPSALRRSKKRSATPSAFVIRRAKDSDRAAVHAFIAATGFFRPDEVDIAMEVFDDAVAQGPVGDYQSYTLEMSGKPVGWVCFGLTACTVGTYDIYWIAVDPAVQAKGLGSALISQAETLIADAGGRIAVIETSGRAAYLPTQLFYLKNNYIEASRLKDFYAPGDDKITYTKNLAPSL